MARLYNAISVQSSGERGLRMLRLGGERELDATRLRFGAEQLARAADASGSVALQATIPEVERIRSETAAAIEAERARRPFEDFAIWLGREADRCAPLVPPGP